MMRLNILNLERFLQVVNSCCGAVYQVGPDGSRTDLRLAPALQDRLRERHSRNKGMLPLTLSVPGRADYMRIVSYYAGDC